MEDIQMKSYLQQLDQMCKGDITSEVSMYIIGEHLGLDKNEAGSLAEDLIIDGLAELKTLAGGISITVKGLEALGKSGGSGVGESAAGLYIIDSKEVLDDIDQQAVTDVLEAVKQEIFSNVEKYDDLEELVVDIKTIETQLLSKRPKTTIIKAVLISIAEQLQRRDNQPLGSKITRMTGAG